MRSSLSLLFSEESLEDLRDIPKYSQEKWGSDQRRTMEQAIDMAMDELARFPLIGASVEHLRPKYRRKRFQQYSIYYTVSDRFMKIIRVVQSRRDIDELM